MAHLRAASHKDKLHGLRGDLSLCSEQSGRSSSSDGEHYVVRGVVVHDKLQQTAVQQSSINLMDLHLLSPIARVLDALI